MIGKMTCGIYTDVWGRDAMEGGRREGEHRFYTYEIWVCLVGGYHLTMYISINVRYE